MGYETLRKNFQDMTGQEVFAPVAIVPAAVASFLDLVADEEKEAVSKVNRDATAKDNEVNLGVQSGSISGHNRSKLWDQYNSAIRNRGKGKNDTIAVDLAICKANST